MHVSYGSLLVCSAGSGLDQGLLPVPGLGRDCARMKEGRKEVGRCGQSCRILTPVTGISFPNLTDREGRVLRLCLFHIPKHVWCLDGRKNQGGPTFKSHGLPGAQSQSSGAPGCSWVLASAWISFGLLFSGALGWLWAFPLGRFKCLWQVIEVGGLAKARDSIKVSGLLPFPLEGRGFSWKRQLRPSLLKASVWLASSGGPQVSVSPSLSPSHLLWPPHAIPVASLSLSARVTISPCLLI